MSSVSSVSSLPYSPSQLSNEVHSYLFHIGHEPPTKGQSLIFCNGKETPRGSAEKSANLISQALDNKIVKCFYNPARINSDSDDSEAISKVFAEFIKEEIQLQLKSGCSQDEIRIVLFLHSHSALIALNALEYISPTEKNTLEIYSFGAAKIIPNNCARHVTNYVHEYDLIAESSSLTEKKPSLFHIKQIYEQEKLGVHRYLAIFRRAELDLFLHINPNRDSYSLESTLIKEDKDKRYRQIFSHPNPTSQPIMEDSFFQERCKYYLSLFTDYNVVILPGIPRNPIQAASFEEFCQTNLREVVANSFKNHLFTSYARTVFDSRFKAKL